MRFTISVKPGLIGKTTNMAGEWLPREVSPQELAEWSFFNHTGYSHSVFDLDAYREAYQGEDRLRISAKRNEFFLYSEVITCDIDSKDLSDAQRQHATLQGLLDDPFIAKHAVLITPSSGNTSEKPNWHITFVLDERVTDTDTYLAVARAVQTRLSIPTDRATARAAQPTMGTLYKDPDRHEAGYLQEDIYVNPDATRVPLSWVKTLDEYELRKKRLSYDREDTVAGKNYQQTDTGNRRVEAHLQQSEDVREKVVLECLSFILSNWHEDKSNEQWFQLWTAAHHGAPTRSVARYILEHPNVYWSDGDDGKAAFQRRWSLHNHAEGGYTVASIFYLARKAGWLRRTGYEIPSWRCEHISVEYITEWQEKLKELPSRLLLASQTGSGKTQNIVSMYSRLNSPKTVIFVPTTKLATDLTSTLNSLGVPATLYVDLRTGIPKSGLELAQAQILVTTLQTFATKVVKPGHLAMRDFGLVYVEESDQLISQFARGGGGMWASQVRDYEARAGFDVLRAACEDSGYVWFADATMTQVTLTLAEMMCKIPPIVVVNDYVKAKADVFTVRTKDEAYQAVLESLTSGKRVVFAADTAAAATELAASMEAIGALEGRRSIVLTRHTERRPEVIEFMTDVNSEAEKYDLVSYNSVMASGVSIDKVKPDVTVQVANFLSPRANLQLLNRYRHQNKVICWYRSSEAIHGKKANEVLDEASRKIDQESGLVHVPLLARTKDAALRAEIAAIDIADTILQNRAPREFYENLLREDGRRVLRYDSISVDKVLNHTIKGVRAAKTEFAALISKNWPTVEPIDDKRPARPELTDLEVAYGQRHAEIETALWGNIPDEDPEYIDEVVTEFSRFSYALSSYCKKDNTVTRAEVYMADRGRAITTIANSVTRNRVIGLLRYLYTGGLAEALDIEHVEKRAGKFLQELAANKHLYDLVVYRPRQKWEKLYDPDNSPQSALSFAKTILSIIGLKQRAVRAGHRGYVHSVVNLDRGLQFLRWRTGEDVNLELEEETGEQRAEAKQRFLEMSKDEQEKVVEIWKHEKYTDFADAVLAVEAGDDTGL